MSKEIIDLEKSNYEQVISDGVVLVQFSAPWCGPCRLMSPVIEELAKEQDITVGKVNIDIEQDVAAMYGIRSVPTFIIYNNGEEVDRYVGATSKQYFVGKIADIKENLESFQK